MIVYFSFTEPKYAVIEVLEDTQDIDIMRIIYDDNPEVSNVEIIKKTSNKLRIDEL